MIDKKKIQKFFSNKVILYITSRYFTYFIQFLTSMYIAVELGPVYFGIYGFILLINNYLSLLNFGVPGSINVLLVQNKTDEKKIRDIVANAVFIHIVIALCIVLICFAYYIFDVNLFQKYQLNKYLHFVCLWAILGLFNTLFLTIYRFKNSLFEVAFQQSFTTFLVFVCLFFANGESLLITVVIAQIIGNLICLLLFLIRKKLPLGGTISKIGITTLMSKGMFLFVYLTSFNLIIVSTRSVISAYYSVELFGYFTFSFSLANAILLFLHAFSFIISPKVLEKLHSNDREQVFLVINRINANYVTLTYTILFVALVVFPLFLNFFPQYKMTLTTLNMISLSIMLYTNSFAHSSFLMAQNKEKTLATIALIALLINVLFSFILTLVFHVQMHFVVLSTMLSYFIFGFLCTYFTHRYWNKNIDFKKVMNDFFPFRLFIPYILSIVTVIIGSQYLSGIPLLILIILNHKELGIIIGSVRLVINKSEIVDLQ